MFFGSFVFTSHLPDLLVDALVYVRFNMRAFLVKYALDLNAVMILNVVSMNKVKTIRLQLEIDLISRPGSERPIWVEAIE